MSGLNKLEKFKLRTNTDGLTDVSVKHIEIMKSLRPNQVKIFGSKKAKSTNNPIFNKKISYL